MAGKNRHIISKRFGRVAAIAGALAVGFLGGAAIFCFFPAWGVGAAVALGSASAFSEGWVYWKGVTRAFETIFSGGFKRIPQNVRFHLAKNLALRELMITMPPPKTELSDAELMEYEKQYREKLEDDMDSALGFWDKKDDLKTFANEEEMLRHVMHVLQEKKIANVPDLVKKFNAKKRWLWVAGGFSLASAVGFFALVFSNAMTYLPYVFALSAGVLTGGALIFATIGAIGYGMLMFTMLFDAIDKGLFKQLVQPLLDVFKSDAEWDTLLPYEKIKFVFENILKTILVLGVISITLFVSIVSAGTYIQASISSALSLFQGITRAVAMLPTEILVGLLILPVTFMFTITNVSSSLKKLRHGATRLLDWMAKQIEEFSANPSQYLSDCFTELVTFLKDPPKVFATLLVLVCFVALIAHVFAEGSLANKGSTTSPNNIDSFSKAVNTVANWLRRPFGYTPQSVRPDTFILDACIVTEGAKDGHFVVGEDPEKAKDVAARHEAEDDGCGITYKKALVFTRSSYQYVMKLCDGNSTYEELTTDIDFGPSIFAKLDQPVAPSAPSAQPQSLTPTP
jgi:hypothetical protein